MDGVGGGGVAPRRMNKALGFGGEQIRPVSSENLNCHLYIGRRRQRLQPPLVHASGLVCLRVYEGTKHSQPLFSDSAGGSELVAYALGRAAG